MSSNSKKILKCSVLGILALLEVVGSVFFGFVCYDLSRLVSLFVFTTAGKVIFKVIFIITIALLIALNIFVIKKVKNQITSIMNRE